AVRVAGVCLLVLIAAGCATDRSVISKADQMHTTLEPAVMSDRQIENYLQSVGDRIIEAAKEADRAHYGPKSHFDSKQRDDWMFSRNMKFHLVNSKTLNAFTTGGEHMYIYNELFQQCKSEDELAAVMSHEYGHVYARHVQKGMNRQIGLVGATTGAGVVGAFLGGDKYN